MKRYYARPERYQAGRSTGKYYSDIGSLACEMHEGVAA